MLSDFVVPVTSLSVSKNTLSIMPVSAASSSSTSVSSFSTTNVSQSSTASFNSSSCFVIPTDGEKSVSPPTTVVSNNDEEKYTDFISSEAEGLNETIRQYMSNLQKRIDIKNPDVIFIFYIARILKYKLHKLRDLLVLKNDHNKISLSGLELVKQKALKYYMLGEKIYNIWERTQPASYLPGIIIAAIGIMVIGLKETTNLFSASTGLTLELLAGLLCVVGLIFVANSCRINRKVMKNKKILSQKIRTIYEKVFNNQDELSPRNIAISSEDYEHSLDEKTGLSNNSGTYGSTDETQCAAIEISDQGDIEENIPLFFAMHSTSSVSAAKATEIEEQITQTNTQISSAILSKLNSKLLNYSEKEISAMWGEKLIGAMPLILRWDIWKIILDYLAGEFFLPLLRKQINQDPKLQKSLMQLVYDTKKEKEFSVAEILIQIVGDTNDPAIAAANAITLLNVAGIELNNLNLRGVKIAGANLSGARLDNTDLQGADLSHVSLHGASLQNANLNYANLTSIKLASGSNDIVLRPNHVTSVCFSYDGLLALGGSDGTIRILDIKLNKELHCLRGHTSRVTSVCFGLGGLLVSGSDDSTVRLWDTTLGKKVYCYLGHEDGVNSVSFSCTGLIASGGNDNTVRIWDTISKKELYCFREHTNIVTSVCFDTELFKWNLVSGSLDHTIRVWDVNTMKEQHCFRVRTDCINSVCFGPTGLLAWAGNDNNTIQLWDTFANKKLNCFHGHTSHITSIDIDEEFLASGSDDNTVRIWDINRKKCLVVLAFTSCVNSVAWLKNVEGKFLATASSDKIVRVFKIMPHANNKPDITLLFEKRPNLIPNLQGASIQGARGLSPENYTLFFQQKAEGTPTVLSSSGVGLSRS